MEMITRVCVAAAAIGLSLAAVGQQSKLQPGPEKPMTEKEKIESRILYQDRDAKFDKPLVEHSPREPEVHIESLPGLKAALPPEQRPADYDCIPLRRTDLIVVGMARDASSHPTASGRFLFTTFEVEMKEVLKDSRRSPVRAGDTILVSRPGGALLLNGRPVTVVDDDYTQIELGKTYVLFLKVIPETDDYASINPGDGDPSFEYDQAKTDQQQEKLTSCLEMSNENK